MKNEIENEMYKILKKASMEDDFWEEVEREKREKTQLDDLQKRYTDGEFGELPRKESLDITPLFNELEKLRNSVLLKAFEGNALEEIKQEYIKESGELDSDRLEIEKREIADLIVGIRAFNQVLDNLDNISNIHALLDAFAL